MVILGRRSMAYQAARAMTDNHVGAVLVTRPPGIAGIVADRDLPAIEDKLARSLGLTPETASESLRAVLKVIAESCDRVR
jgi:hypothetical protein